VYSRHFDLRTALTASFAQHGGRLHAAQARYPQAPQPWIDLSTGINPQPYPAPHASDAARSRLPTIEEVRALEAMAGRCFGIEDAADRVVATAGSESAIRLMPYALRTQAAVVVGPTYCSHAEAYRAAGLKVDETRLEKVAPSDAAITVVNPNNPDGTVIEPARLLNLHDDFASRQGYVVVDEAFADVEPECSVAAVAGAARYPRLIVLRSFGKFYGLAGVRLGFVVAASPIIVRLRELLGDWAISADAIVAGLRAYADSEWAATTRQTLLHSARRLDDVLFSCGFTIVGGTSLFRLARSDDAQERFARLLAAGILVRPFNHDPSLLRFGLPHGSSAWQRLTDSLRLP
jgi:cobalamin biosynthetic protein CobC